MNSMETSGIQANVASLERRLGRAERWILLHKIGWTLLAGLIVFHLWTSAGGDVQAQSQKLRLRELAIVDEKGRGANCDRLAASRSDCEWQGSVPDSSGIGRSSIESPGWDRTWRHYSFRRWIDDLRH